VEGDKTAPDMKSGGVKAEIEVHVSYLLNSFNQAEAVL
jgi:hypothetical protein